jgi:nucleoid-associated protein YgaU
MLFKGSRYTGVAVIQPVGADGKSRRSLALRPIAAAPGVLQHVVAEGERLDQLANNFYAEPSKYWLILDANLDTLNPFELLQTGRTIAIPQNRIVPS